MVDMELFQMEVKIMFLHGNLHEDISMQQPDGFAITSKDQLV